MTILTIPRNFQRMCPYVPRAYRYVLYYSFRWPGPSVLRASLLLLLDAYTSCSTYAYMPTHPSMFSPPPCVFHPFLRGLSVCQTNARRPRNLFHNKTVTILHSFNHGRSCQTPFDGFHRLGERDRREYRPFIARSKYEHETPTSRALGSQGPIQNHYSGQDLPVGNVLDEQCVAVHRTL